MQFDRKKTIFLIDGSLFLYRAYYGLRPIHTKSGEPIQAVYSFCRMIKKMINLFDPEYFVLVWDSKGPTTRHEMYPAYKATRQAPPSDIFEQKKHILEFADLIGLRQIAQPGIEADDIMYSIAQERKREGDTSVFITADKDMSQALDDHTFMYDPFKEQIIDVAAFITKRGFPVAKLPFFFAILGDASDNIPGVKGIGEKGALDLVTQFESLDDLYAHIDRVGKPRNKQLLLEQKENAYLSQKLFLLQYHPTGLSKQDLSFDRRNWSKARELFIKLDFNSLLKEMDKQEAYAEISDKAVVKKLEQYDFKSVTTLEQLKELCSLIKQKGLVAVDTETDGLDVMNAQLVGISLCVQAGTSYYIPLAHKDYQQQIARHELLEHIKPIMENEQIKKIFHNAKFDQHALMTEGIRVRGIIFDTMVAASLVIKDWQRAGLKDLSEFYLNEPMLSFKEVVKDNKYKDFSYVPLELATAYAAADAHQTFRLKKPIQDDLHTEKMSTLYEQLEGPLAQILTDIEAEGIIVDVAFLHDLSTRVGADLQALEEQILTIVGKEKYSNLNLNSPRQIEQLLFVDLGLPPKKKSAKGTGYSTDQEVLEELSSLHPVPSLILKYRELSKLKNTYIDALPEYVNPKTGRIHTTFNQIATATGRLASNDPNLQNIPTNSGYGIEIRQAFKPNPGDVFLSADYSQIELRVLAHLSGDTNLTAAFLSGHDIHAQTAARLFGVNLDEVTSKQRQLGKRINFSILYGLTPYGLSKDLGIPFKDAKIYIERYFQQYPAVQEWMDKVIQDTKHAGYVTTHWGRRRYIPAIYEHNKSLYEEARRIAINTVAQGTAAEIMKIGMINLTQALAQAGLGAKIILQIHDELLLSVPQAEREQTEQLVKKVLETVVEWRIPLQVSTRFGADWREVTK